MNGASTIIVTTKDGRRHRYSYFNLGPNPPNDQASAIALIKEACIFWAGMAQCCNTSYDPENLISFQIEGLPFVVSSSEVFV